MSENGPKSHIKCGKGQHLKIESIKLYGPSERASQNTGSQIRKNVKPWTESSCQKLQNTSIHRRCELSRENFKILVIFWNLKWFFGLGDAQKCLKTPLEAFKWVIMVPWKQKVPACNRNPCAGNRDPCQNYMGSS